MSSQAHIRNNEISYLMSQIDNTRDLLQVEAHAKYLGDDPDPRTKEDMQKRLADGKFIVVSKYTDGRYPNVRWRSPDKKEDQEGYNKAMSNIDQAFETARDAANVLPAPEALKELKKFKELQV